MEPAASRIRCRDLNPGTSGMSGTDPMHTDLPKTRDLVFIGGGHTHALVLRNWGMNPLPGARLTLINPAPEAPYTGMLPGFVAGHYTRQQLDMDLVRLAHFAGARIVLAKAIGLDRDNQRVQVEGRSDIAYDALSINVGITSTMPSLPGFTEHAFGAKPLGRFSHAWQDFVADVKSGMQPATVAVIGAGVAGAELAMAMAYRLKTETGKTAQVHLLEARDEILREIGDKARAKLTAHLERLNVSVRTNARAEKVETGQVLLEGGDRIDAAFTVGAAGARPYEWLQTTGLALRDGFLEVDAHLRCKDETTIFAAGDCAHMLASPRSKAGVFAVRQAPILQHNLSATLSGRPLKSFNPQSDYLKLISTGGKGAVADKFRMTFDGPLLWQLKDYIDQKFMRQFEHLPASPQPTLPAIRALSDEPVDASLCGGCGAKVEHDALQNVLTQLPPKQRSDVLSGPGDDAAILAESKDSNKPHQLLTIDHLRALIDDPWLMSRIAAIHALGDIWAMGAAPQAAVATITLPRLSARLQTETLREIMHAASDVFANAGADIVGGHSSQGAELSIGFAVTALTSERVITNAGAQPGNMLILTKPIGTGILNKAAMTREAEGEWLKGAWTSMAQDQSAAAAILAKHATAMTDITGFGLANHLLAVCRASSVSADLDLSAIPILPGAEQLAAQGIHSSIWPSNKAAASPFMKSAKDSPQTRLLYDPQTAGGLLACVPESVAQAVHEQVRELGMDAAIIGSITDGTPEIRL